MASRVKVTGGDRLLKALKALPREMTAEVRARIKAEAEALAADVRARTPVDTGALRNAVRVRTSQGGLFARVGIFAANRVRAAGAAAGLMQRRGLSKRQAARTASALARDPFYAHFVEFGTRKMPARPFLFPTFKEKRRRILAGIADAAKRAIKKVT